MTPHDNELVDLEKRFWQSMVDDDTDTALSMLAEPSMMVSEHGVMKFDHDGYRQMAEKGSMTLKDFRFSDMEVEFPSEDVAVVTYKVRQTIGRRDSTELTTQEMADSSTWIRQDGSWLCVMHTETPVSH